MNEPDFGNAFGEAFQAYVGEVATRAAKGTHLSILPEEEYWVGRDRKDTVDWVIEDESGLLFLECKTKRLTLTAKLELLSMEALSADLEKLADFIVQIYKNVRDYQEARYPHPPPRPDRPIYPLVVTLEAWHAFGNLIWEELEAKVTPKLQSERLPPEWSTEMPYLCCSVADFEQLMQVIARRGISATLRMKAVDAEYRKWEMHSYLIHAFAEDVKNLPRLFPEDFEKLGSQSEAAQRVPHPKQL